MKTEYHIIIKDFCETHQIEEAFVLRLHEYDVIDLAIVKDQYMISDEQLPKLEQMVRLHRQLFINVEGLSAVDHLLEKINTLQGELLWLKRKLDRFKES
ncbi:chaperone modulator CbpM [Spongiivirga sp. MCCC 1A20706]|uniref:chaperone modulator CbpM n=1 Tax=Spongiivirga sp. MCCC 1A20706 TaxID=3160963 RepID=UPI003977DAA2